MPSSSSAPRMHTDMALCVLLRIVLSFICLPSVTFFGDCSTTQWTFWMSVWHYCSFWWPLRWHLLCPALQSCFQKFFQAKQSLCFTIEFPRTSLESLLFLFFMLLEFQPLEKSFFFFFFMLSMFGYWVPLSNIVFSCCVRRIFLSSFISCYHIGIRVVLSGSVSVYGFLDFLGGM